MEKIEEEVNIELEIFKIKEFAYWEDQLMKCASGEKADFNAKTIMAVLHERFGWELPNGYAVAGDGST